MQAETCYRKSIICILVRDLNKLFQSMASAFPFAFPVYFFISEANGAIKWKRSLSLFHTFSFGKDSRLSGWCFQLNGCRSQLIHVIFHFIPFHHFTSLSMLKLLIIPPSLECTFSFALIYLFVSSTSLGTMRIEWLITIMKTEYLYHPN